MNNIQDDETREKSKERRKQVIDAAAKCFRKGGFHGSSIARISKVAGMSPGHIYYHFANKEAIVEALVAQQESSLMELVNDIACADPDEALVTTLTRHTQRMVDCHITPEFVGLRLEIAAESARNPAVAKILHQSHKAISRRLDEQLIARVKIDNQDDMQRLRAKMDVIATIFNGLSLYSLLWSEEDKADKSLLVDTINGVIVNLIKDQ
ncbi:TetR/AcrR family transcriptional regulator [Pectobacterium actinidiae]|uniref:TetR/AcrR family transcriptional regulator n=1 Tax=Pectobacterium actinidiae TaxID=1507808 RepID=UPI0024A33D79|nr:TetR/AcrR family transcriptional regulator [Pectobacterium actinidiae]MDY4316508.1 TetR/AcrR family transcriptional regulator [Pectobacterium actinidiae]GLW36131.1 TetR family transcriptional regulator [Pectobacterium carotovorum subsp. carotovorum]